MSSLSRFRLLLLACLLVACTTSPNVPPTPTPLPPTPVPTPTVVIPVTSKELHLLGWTEYVPQTLITGFENEYGVKVTYSTFSSDEELLAMLAANPGAYDVIQPSDYVLDILKKNNRLAQMDSERLPNLVNLDPFFRNPDYDPGLQYSVPYQWGTDGILVNTAKTTIQVSSWNDLWRAEFRGKVLLFDSERPVIAMTLVMLGYDANSVNGTQLAHAQSRLKDLKPNVAVFNSDAQREDFLAERVWIGQVWNGEAALAHNANPAMLYVIPKEGALLWTDSLAIPNDAPHRDAADAFINYVLRPDVSLLITAEFPYSTPNRAALDLLRQTQPDKFEAYMHFNGTNPSSAEIRASHRLLDIGDAVALYDPIWTEVRAWLP